MRNLFHDLTGDAAVPSNSKCKLLDERLQQMFELQDPDIVIDLRVNNGFKGTKFDIFWEELSCYFNEVQNIYIINNTSIILY